MQPMGRRKIKFPSKTKEWVGKNILMWWEVLDTGNKKRERQYIKIQIKKDYE